MAKAIVQAVQQQDPPGRFLEMAQKDSGMWKQITYKRAVDKTSQALREKEPPAGSSGAKDVMPVPDPAAQSEAVAAAVAASARKGKKSDGDLSELTKATLKQAGLDPGDGHQISKRKAPQSQSEYAKHSWWNRGADNNASNQAHKRMKMEQFDSNPPPPEPLEVRQSSLFRFMRGTSIFGLRNTGQNQQPQQQRSQSGFFSFSGGGNNSGNMRMNTNLRNPGDMITAEAAHFGSSMNNLQNNNQFGMPQLQNFNSGFDPLPLSGGNPQQAQFNNSNLSANFQFNQQQMQQHQMQMHQQMQQMQMQQRQMRQHKAMYGNNNSQNANNDQFGMEELPRMGLIPSGTVSNGSQPFASSMPQENGSPMPPPTNRMTTQVSDWLTSFWPLGKEAQQEQNQSPPPPPPPPPPPTGNNLERSISSTLFNLARSPSNFLTSLKSGVSSMFAGEVAEESPEPSGEPFDVATSSNASLGTVPQRDSLLDDYEETPLETRLRSVTSR